MQFIKNHSNIKRFFPGFIVLLFGVISVIDLVHPGFTLTHDGQDHIARIANFYANLSQGIFIPRWAANLNWGYGHPILEFLYPLPSYIASLLHLIGFSFVDSTKIVFALSMIGSGLAMYWLVKCLWGNTPAIVAGVVYMYAPYQFVDLYVRGDLGERVAFVFVPLVFLGALFLARKQTTGRLIFASCMLALLILAHNAVALMFMPVLLLYLLFLWYSQKWSKKVLISFLLFFLFGFLLSSFFWVPALFEGQYTLRNIVTKGEYVTRFVSLSQLLYGQWNYGQTGMFTVQLGILQWIFLAWGLGFLLFGKKTKQSVLLVLGILITTGIAIFLMLSVSNFIWSRTLLLQNFQFPWRFLAIPVFTTAFLGGFCITSLPDKWKVLGTVVICLFVLLLSREYIQAKAYVQRPENFFTGVYRSTTDTGESSPIWSIRFMLHTFDRPLDVISGNAQIQQEKRLTTYHKYTVTSVGQSRLLENTLYFPGWSVVVDGRPVVIQFQDPAYRGLMTFLVGNGKHTVIVTYHESKLRLVGDILSVVGLVALLAWMIGSKVWVLRMN